MIDSELVENFIRHIEDSQTNGVPELHFRFWNKSSDEAKQQYIDRFRSDSEAMDWYEESYLGDDPDFDALVAMPDNTLGHQYARHIIDNGLNKTIASDYRRAHEKLDSQGRLHGMPDEAKYAVLRGFQIHDIFHVLTAYKTTGWGEMALQAFTLAQRPLPYASLWMATLTAQMTFIRPDMTVAVMDAISHGWQRGRTAKNLNYEHWEDRFADDVDELREEFGLAQPVKPLD